MVLVTGALIVLSAFLPLVTNVLVSVSGLALDDNDAVLVLPHGVLVAVLDPRFLFLEYRYTTGDGV